MAVTALVASSLPALAASATSASFSKGGVVVDGTRYAQSGTKMTLDVTTSSDTKCVVFSGAHTGQQTHRDGKTSWSQDFTTGSGNGTQTVTATAYPTHADSVCSGTSGATSASYVLDNTGPTVTADLTPAANSAGWNKADVAIVWQIADSGIGADRICGTNSKTLDPCTDSVVGPTALSGVVKTSTGKDRLGNSTTGSVTVKIDKGVPTVTGTRAPAANSAGWNNSDVTVSFTSSDALSGIKTAAPTTVLSTDGANQSVTGTATDNADNTGSATVSGISIDKTPPTLSGAATTPPPNGQNGWYTGDVTVAWTANDPLSGLSGSVPGNATLTGEGAGQSASASVSDRAGNSTTASSTPVNIDRTPPLTSADATGAWNNSDVTVTLSPSDGGSGVASTHYQVNGGAVQTGTSVPFTAQGEYALTYWSVDRAGHIETAKSATVKIDKSNPTIESTRNPAANGAGWNNSDVTVSFICNDTGGSGIATCTTPRTITAEADGQDASGEAVDRAGNRATATVFVSLDKTKPTVTASADRLANLHGWYKAPVIVTYTANDTLSGIATGSVTSPQTLVQGGNQQTSGSASDIAGNSQSATLTGINIDTTPPTLGGTPSTSNWSNGDVVVSWSCQDTLSSLDGSCPGDSTVSGEGSDLSASQSVSDLAGNTTTTTVRGIRIDRTVPSTSAGVSGSPSNGWYSTAPNITLTGTDTLSEVASTFYSVDGGLAQRYAGPFAASNGVHTYTFWSEDNAGNVEIAGTGLTLSVDTDKPTITGTAAPAANLAGWNNSPVTVTFTCNDALSDIASCTGPVEVGEGSGVAGAGQSVTGTATDKAGNSEEATVSGIKVDLTKPTSSASATAGSGSYASGVWTKETVSVELVGSDALSGVKAVHYTMDGTEPTTGSAVYNGALTFSSTGETTVKYVAVDIADNVQASASQFVVQVDKTAPNAPTFNGITSGATFTTATVPAQGDISCTTTDSGGSGLLGCTVTGYNAAAGGPYTLTATATDNAGNTSTSTLTYTVTQVVAVAQVWTHNGFHNPIGVANTIVQKPNANGTVAAAPAATDQTLWNTAKGGSTIPLKFNVIVDGTERINAALVANGGDTIRTFGATRLSSCTSSTGEPVEELASAGSSSLRYSGTPGIDGQFIQNWKTSTVSGEQCWRVALTTVDNTVMYTFVKLRK